MLRMKEVMMWKAGIIPGVYEVDVVISNKALCLIDSNQKSISKE